MISEAFLCILEVDTTNPLRHINESNSERPVCRTHLLAPNSTSLLFVFDIEKVRSSCKHQGRASEILC